MNDVQIVQAYNTLYGALLTRQKSNIEKMTAKTNRFLADKWLISSLQTHKLGRIVFYGHHLKLLTWTAWSFLHVMNNLQL